MPGEPLPIAGGWPALVERLDGAATLARWSAAEPVLAGLSRVEDLPGLEHSDRVRADEVVGALVRLAAADGAGDDDALLVVLHLLSGVVLSLSRQLVDLSPDILTIVVNELACQIRAYPWRRRRRAWAANLKAATRAAVMAELLPRVRNHPLWGDVLTDNGDTVSLADELGDFVPGPDEEPDLDVLDLLRWAVRSGVDAAGIALLIQTECCRDRDPVHADQKVAAEHGFDVRTLYRRRARTLTALRGAAVEYLAAVA